MKKLGIFLLGVILGGLVMLQVYIYNLNIYEICSSEERSNCQN